MDPSLRQVSAPLVFGVVGLLCGLTALVLQFFLAETLPRFGGRVGSWLWDAQYLLLPIAVAFAAFRAVAGAYYRFELRTDITAIDHLRHCLMLYAGGGFLAVELLGCWFRSPGASPCHPDAMIVGFDLAVSAFIGIVVDLIAWRSEAVA